MQHGTVLASKGPPKPPLAEKVMEEAIRRKWITAFSDGQYVYGAKWAKLVRLLQEELVARAQSLGFEEWILPRYIPQQAFDSFKLTQFAPDLLLPAGYGSYLDPVQCISFYEHLRGRTLSKEQLPLRVVEIMGGWTWRNEQHDRMDGPYRAREFLRVEHVFCGSRQQVRDQRRQTRDNLLDLLTKLELGWQVVVGHGCMDIPSLTQARMTATQPDDIPVQDIEVPIRHALHKLPELPAPGTTSHEVLKRGRLVKEISDAAYWEHDEICGCSVEGDHLTKDFGIMDVEGNALWSGCCGIGLNRLVLALLYQHGFEDVEDVVQDAVGCS
jgi:seryl-tRNA synthetase